VQFSFIRALEMTPYQCIGAPTKNRGFRPISDLS
jgi:hypothetical protein